MSKQLSTILSTTVALLGQFQDALSATSAAGRAETPKDAEALPLLSASSAALKAQVTKLSLLAISSPFTHTAVTGVIRDLNDSVLPSLVTAALLVTPTQYTKAFHSEILVLSKTALTELSTLVQEVQRVADQKDRAKKENPAKKEAELTQFEKDAVTLATGRVWDACETVTDVATKGVVGFVMRRVEQWRDLVRDAIEEIEEWDPNEEGDAFFDDLMGDDDAKARDDDSEDDDEDTAASHEQKKSTIRFLKPIAQVYPAIINNRLKKAGTTPSSSLSGVTRLQSLMASLQPIPDHVDEAAGALYEANLAKSARFLVRTKKCAVQAVNVVMAPWDAANGANGQTQAEDKFTVWSKTWLKVVDEVSKPIDAAAGPE
ncbi:hypothetical protein NUU61_005573 [Penicillium alfredii]|uniref:Cyclin-D1-binding protein 1-like N-terminal domain-containing protein n=1 Tax=Penicillium alfredii TaxID=1506179 RepID=A0A9W9FA54_9EURO|nr:uncharacterized protein NUU61_005573 [Penicillium alfredii]KAJ5096217.1 hypothetical protein NUU61_005573 [Penicillium alfredii]